MHSLLLFAPFDVNFEFDIREFLKGGNLADQSIGSALECLKEKVSRGGDNVYWRMPKQILPSETKSSSYGADAGTYRAPSRRPVWFCRAFLKPQNSTFQKIADWVSKYNFRLEDIVYTFQDYGIGVIELRFGIEEAKIVSAKEYCENVQDICWRLPEKIRGDLSTRTEEILKAGTACGFNLADETSSLVHRFSLQDVGSFNRDSVRIEWFHSVLVFDNSDNKASGVGGREWCQHVSQQGIFPQTNTLCDDALRLKKAELIRFVTRDIEAAVFFGWGNSCAVVWKKSEGIKILDAIPLQHVMNVMQSYSAALFNLNADLLQETLNVSLEKTSETYKEFKKKTEVMDNLRFRADIFLALLKEQRYCHDAVEGILWDGCLRAWDIEKIENDIRGNIEILKQLYHKGKEGFEEILRKRLTLGVTVITFTSASAVLFQMIESFLGVGGPNWEKIFWQTLILVVLLLMSGILFILPKKLKT